MSIEKIERPHTKSVFEVFSDLDVKVVFDRAPLLGTGPLPDWLRNLAHSRAMITLDSYRDNLCLWRCIAVHQGARSDRATNLQPLVALRRGFSENFKMITREHP